ncbi:hypothetical protein JTE90_017506 [Oedothorax gibbosus]|uniref:Uncharacterized protein n=1 Tax=Oedothorax gibbosus TaxID=931172 RepID=A0AAV6UAZ5_9ARAC|nr:hypothetical protein JTE90_017506 [Oedothorax gibbosus]
MEGLEFEDEKNVSEDCEEEKEYDPVKLSLAESRYIEIGSYIQSLLIRVVFDGFAVTEEYDRATKIEVYFLLWCKYLEMHWCLIFLLSYAMGSELRPKRRPSEDRVTIDLSALRPSLPGLVLYEYGDLAPKLVQVDLSSLNPLIQPHVIWPQFNQMDLDRPFELEGAVSDEAIPYLTMEDAAMSPRRMARLEDWRDMYDFVQDGSHDPMLSLHGSLPLADEVIVPLDWEEDKNKKKKQKKNGFLTKGWRAGGERGRSGTSQKQTAFPKMPKGMTSSNFNSYYSRNGVSRPSPSYPRRRETESEEARKTATRQGKKDGRSANQDEQPVLVPSQESWSVPRQYWNVPHLFVNNYQ